MVWPSDAVGDVLHRMKADGFDFAAPHLVSFMVDFERWPPPQDAIIRLKGRFSVVSREEPDEEEDQDGYLVCTVEAPVTYEFVTDTQREITALVQQFGGSCTDWIVSA